MLCRCCSRCLQYSSTAHCPTGASVWLVSNCLPVWQVISAIDMNLEKIITKSITLWAWPKRKYLKDWREFLFAPASLCAWCYRLSQSWGAGCTPSTSICLRMGKQRIISLWIFPLVHKKRKPITLHAYILCCGGISVSWYWKNLRLKKITSSFPFLLCQRCLGRCTHL